jgi:hypothetical protein
MPPYATGQEDMEALLSGYAGMLTGLLQEDLLL